MAHLHGMLASGSAKAILLKRGPGKASGTIGWDRQRDTFEVGQWLRKPIDYQSCDLSPSGALFSYWVNTQRWTTANHVYRVVSRTPWLTAAAFWGSEPRGLGPGVSLFIDEKRIWSMRAQKAERDAVGLTIETELPSRWQAFADPQVCLYLRLQRDGWLALGADRTRPRVFEKEIAHGWKLRQTHVVGPAEKDQPISRQTFALVSPKGEVEEQPWEWADADRPRQRVVWTERGVVSAGDVTAKGAGAPAELFDARALRFEERSAPY